jgi:hypothetical protein
VIYTCVYEGLQVLGKGKALIECNLRDGGTVGHWPHASAWAFFAWRLHSQETHVEWFRNCVTKAANRCEPGQTQALVRNGGRRGVANFDAIGYNRERQFLVSYPSCNLETLHCASARSRSNVRITDECSLCISPCASDLMRGLSLIEYDLQSLSV